MMQSADPGQLNHLSALGRPGLGRALNGSVFAESIMGSVIMIILKIRDQNPLQVTFLQHDHVIKTINAN